MVPQKSFGELPRSSTPRSLLTVSGWQPLLLRRLTTASITERSGVGADCLVPSCDPQP